MILNTVPTAQTNCGFTEFRHLAMIIWQHGEPLNKCVIHVRDAFIVPDIWIVTEHKWIYNVYTG